MSTHFKTFANSIRIFSQHFHPSTSFRCAQPNITTSKQRNRWKTSLANWHFAHFWMRQASQFYFHLVWYFCDTLTADCHSILNKFYYENFLLFCTFSRHWEKNNWKRPVGVPEKIPPVREEKRLSSGRYHNLSDLRCERQ